MRRIVALSVCIIMVVCSMQSLTPALAGQITPYYTYISVMQAGIGILGSTAYCSGYVATAYSYDVSITMTLMRRSGSIWVTVKSWSGSGYGVDGASLSKSQGLTISGDYKVVVLGKILDESGNVLESKSATSGIDTY